MPELPEVETIRRDLEREVVGKRIKTVEVTGTARSAGTRTKKQFIGRLEGTQDHRRRPQGQVPAAHARHRRRARRPPRHERPAAAGRRAKDPADKHTHVVITFTQGGQLRFVDPRTFGELFVVSARASSPRRCPSSPTSASTRSTSRCRGPSSASCCSAQADEAQGAADGPDVHRRHRQHLQRRDPVRRRAALRPHAPTRCRPRRSAGCTGRWSRCCTRRSSTGGSTLADEQYVDLFGQPGEYQDAAQGVRPRRRSRAAAAGATIVQGQVPGPLDLLLRRCQV